MTEVTRIACPGCRSLLRFEPEALDFPANCGACDCRFTAGIYVRVSLPELPQRVEDPRDLPGPEGPLRPLPLRLPG